jgi:hypothetical protein
MVIDSHACVRPLDAAPVHFEEELIAHLKAPRICLFITPTTVDFI